MSSDVPESVKDLIKHYPKSDTDTEEIFSSGLECPSDVTEYFGEEDTYNDELLSDSVNLSGSFYITVKKNEDSGINISNEMQNTVIGNRIIVESKYFRPTKRLLESFYEKNRTDRRISELEKEIADLNFRLSQQTVANTNDFVELISLKAFYVRLNKVIVPTVGVLSSLLLFIICLSFFSGIAQILTLLSSLILLGLNLKTVIW